MRRRQPWWWCHQHDTKLRFLANSNHPNSLLIQVPSFSPKATLRKFFDASALSRSKTNVATPGNHMGQEPLQHQSYLLSPKLPWQDLAHEMMDKREQDLAYTCYTWIILARMKSWHQMTICGDPNMSYSNKQETWSLSKKWGTIGTLHCRSFVVTIQLGCWWQSFIASVVWVMKLWVKRWMKLSQLPCNARIQPATGSTIAAKCFLEGKETATKTCHRNHLKLKCFIPWTALCLLFLTPSGWTLGVFPFVPPPGQRLSGWHSILQGKTQKNS